MSRARAVAVLAVLAGLAGALVALPVVAEVYHVTLLNGSTIDTRYPPQDSPWDANRYVLMTDVGNWISLAKADIAEIVTDTQNKGFGFVINTTTIALGWAPNDALTPEQQAEADTQAARLAAEAPPTPYSVDQFVEPSATQGIPAGWLGYGTTPPIGGIGAGVPAPAPPSGGGVVIEPPQQ